MTNLQIAIEKALAALEPSTLQRYEDRKLVDIYEVKPAFIGPLQRRTIELLVDAAIKYSDSLKPVDVKPTPADVLQAYAETVP
jgi:hypothetical protein